MKAPNASVQMPVSRANAIDIVYDVAGAGPALVLVHALPFDRHLWQFQVAAFRDRFTCIAMDLRGWGASAKPREPFSLRDMGDDVMGVLADCGVKGDATVMGCSIGSKIALMLACDHPDVFRSAILVGGNSGPQHQFDHRIAAYRAHAAAGTLADYHLSHLRHGVTQAWADTDTGRRTLAPFVERGVSLDAESIACVFHALTVSDLTPKLAACRTPTLIVNGEHDSALPGGTRTASLLRYARHEIIPATGHCCFLENPRAFNALVEDFLIGKGLAPGAGRMEPR
jgi:3-oxoadipate enol-lactonase